MARIFQTHVAPLFPLEGAVRVMLFGEAPGPRGADQSGIPFWGDRSGVLVYRALETVGLAQVPGKAYDLWDGGRFRDLGLKPVLKGAALSNAYPRCPTRDGHTFKAPTDAELKEPANCARLRQELSEAAAHCEGRLRVIAMGKRSEWILSRIEDAPDFELHALCHPSAQGLLHAAPGKGKGLRLADLAKAWEDRLLALLMP